MGRLPATETAYATTLQVASKTTDLFGLSPASQPGLDQHTAAGPFDISLEALDTPFGNVKAAVRLNPNGTRRLVCQQHADTQLTIRANWADLLDWIHADTLIGHLLHTNRAQTQGPITAISYTEGHISWPKTPQDQKWGTHFSQTMKTYRQHRHNPQYLELMDHIESTTTP